MLSTLFGNMFTRVFVNIVVSRSSTLVYIEISNKKDVIKKVDEVFGTTSLSNKMYSFIESYIKETPFYYISFLDTSEFQGMAPTCSSREISKFFDVNVHKYLCYSNKYAFYTLKSDLQLLQKAYSKIGIDFIFSPFIILTRIFQDKVDKSAAMYILVEDTRISLAVFDSSELLYAEYMVLEQNGQTYDLLNEAIATDYESLDFDGTIDLDNMNADLDMGDLDSFGDFDDIEDLDTLEDMDDFSDVKTKNEKAVTLAKKTNPVKDETPTLTEDYARFLLIQNSLNTFYNDEKFASAFIEKVFIASGVDSGTDLKKYLEEEIFLNVVLRHVDLGAELCDLARAEIK